MIEKKRKVMLIGKRLKGLDVQRHLDFLEAKTKILNILKAIH